MFRKTYSIMIATLVLVAAVARADGPRYTRSDLENFSTSRLIDLVLDLQDRLYGPDHGNNGGGNGGGWGDDFSGRDCKTYNPLNGESGSVLTRVNHSGYTDDGTLKWPNGQTFLLRNSGYTNDKTMYYPNGKTLRLRNSGYTNDNTLYWPNGQTLLLRNTGYTNDGTISRADGSVWLRRNSGYSNDRERVGLPVDQFTDGDLEMRARLTDNDSVVARMILRGPQYRVVVDIDPSSSDAPVVVRECFSF